MGGYGSGFNGVRRATVDESTTIDSAWLRRNGYIVPGEGRSGVLRWTCGDRETGSVGCVVDLRPGSVPCMVLRYQVGRGESVRNLEYQVELVTTAPGFGGVRVWFRCPLDVGGRMCGRRVAKLHSPPGAAYFGCRQCHNLTYRSCQESHKWDGLFRLLAVDVGSDAATVRRLLKRRGW